MFNFKQYNWRNLNIVLVLIVSILCLISSYAIKLSGGESLFKRQLMGLAIGLVVVAIVTLIDYHFILRFVGIYYILVVLILALVRFSPLGTDNNTGVNRWINIGPLNLQPSELAKITIILVFAALFAKLEERMDKVSTLFISILVMAVPTYLIFDQPDLSSSLVMVFIFTVMIFAAGLSYKFIGTVIALGIPLGALFLWYIQQPFQILLSDYQVSRVEGFLNRDSAEYALDEMYQQLGSVQAIASGKLYGKLLSEGAGTNRSYNSVGVNESDFIWSVIGEEFGFIGGCLIIGLLVIIIVTCLLIARKAKDLTGKLVAIGISSLFMFQTFANIGVASMILPNTGLPLPFLSYGLSSLVTCMIAIGIILNIGLQQKNSARG